MSIITFTSDFGLKDHYVAAVKASILTQDPLQIIVDISHQVQAFNIEHGAQLIRSVYQDFPKGSVHLVALRNSQSSNDIVVAEINNHFFVTYDSGILGLISSNISSKNVFKVEEHLFPEKREMSDIAMRLAHGTLLTSIGTPIFTEERFLLKQIKLTKSQVAGHVVYIDHFGNLITNISKNDFDKVKEWSSNRSRFVIQLGRHHFHKINGHFNSVNRGEIFVVLNSNDFFTVGINEANASELLGIRTGTPVKIDFH